MKAYHLRRLAPLTLAALALVATPASAKPDRDQSSKPLNADNKTTSWTGKIDPGANPTFFTGEGSCASADARDMCDQTLLRIGDDVVANKNSSIKFKIGSYQVPASDFDIRVYESNAAGDLKSQVGGSPQSETYGPLGAPSQLNTFPGDEESITLTGDKALKAGKYYLVMVVYFATAGNYKGTVEVKDVAKAAPPASEPAAAGLR